jgi:tRNA nucleotidyltransferase (CCA-adding enzyme)
VRDRFLGREAKDADFLVPGVDIDGLERALAPHGRSEELTVAGRIVGVRFHPRDRAVRRLVPAGIELAPPRREVSTGPGRHDFEIVVDASAGVEDDLRRRDFTINAMAIPLLGEPGLVDPFGGRQDLDAGILRVLHPKSFVDDPTRAIRAARYAARFGFCPDEETNKLILVADLGTVSADRREAELLRLAAEDDAAAGFALLAEWGLVELRTGGLELASEVQGLASGPPWSEVATRERALLAAALGPAGREDELAAARPSRPSEAVELARAARPVELLLARALGAEWLDRYLSEWRLVKLEIDGTDLIAAGVAEGPALGRGLAEALRRKLDGEVAGREEELEAALAAVRGSRGVA